MANGLPTNEILTPDLLATLDSEINWTYNGICSFIQKFLNRTDSLTVNAIPQFVSLAQSRLAADLKILSEVNTVQFTLPQTTNEGLLGGNNVARGFWIDGRDLIRNFNIRLVVQAQVLPFSVIIQKPQGYRLTKSLAVVTPMGRNYVYNRSYEFVQEYMNDFNNCDLFVQSNYTGWIYYSDVDISNIIIGPVVSDQEITYEWQYLAEIQKLNSTNQRNYWTIYYPLLLIYGALIYASEFVRSDQRSVQWEATYKQLVGAANMENQQRQLDNSNVRMN